MSEPRLRADARRNRERLLEVARAAFAAGRSPTLDAVAKEAGVGIGTLYRHFPTREALVEAVFRAERDELVARVEPLLAEHDPVTALRTWMDHYADFVATKRGMAEALRAVIADGGVGTREAVNAAVATLLDAGARAGTLRGDARADDVVATLVGIFLATDGAGDRAQVGRMLDLVLDGLCASRS